MENEQNTSRVKLTPEKLQEMKDAITAGESPKSIHERLGISLANIHYHKNRMKKGVLKTKKGKAAVKSATKTAVHKVTETVHAKNGFNLIVNGTTVHISGAAAVSIGEDYIKVNY